MIASAGRGGMARGEMRSAITLAAAVAAIHVACASAFTLPAHLDALGLNAARRARADAADGVAHDALEATNVEFFFDAQIVDHFAPSDEFASTWSQRYFVNDTFRTDPKAPVFLCVGGEGPPLDASVVVTGGPHCAWMINIAARTGGLVLALEHRFYGKSMPKPDWSLESLQVHSSRQALQDLGNFVHASSHGGIDRLAALIDPAARWFTFGGSYPGMMAGWARLKFPHLIHGSIASSAPVQASLDMPGYNDVVARSLAYPLVGGSAACVANVSRAFAELGALLTTASGSAAVAKQFNVCPGSSNALFNNPYNVKMLTETLWGLFPLQSNDPACDGAYCNYDKICSGLFAVNGDDGATRKKGEDDSAFLVRGARKARAGVARDRAGAVEEAAGVFGSGSVPSALAALATLFDAQTNGLSCLSVDYSAMIAQLKEDVTSQDRSWLWQVCTEFGFYQTCNADSQCPFKVSPPVSTVTTFQDTCVQVFNVSLEATQAHIAQSNVEYGGWFDPDARTFFVNGDVDPWSANSVTQIRVDGQHVMIVPGASHHFWTHPVKATDWPSINDARHAISNVVMGWMTVEEEKKEGWSTA